MGREGDEQDGGTDCVDGYGSFVEGIHDGVLEDGESRYEKVVDLRFSAGLSVVGRAEEVEEVGMGEAKPEG